MAPATLHWYIAGIVLATLTTVVACQIGRMDPTGKGVMIARILSIILLGKGLLWFYTTFNDGPWRASFGLPLYLCDIAVFVGAAACWWRNRFLVDLLYFWALAGVIEGVITPDLPRTLSSLLVFQYTLGHLVIISAAIYLVVGLKLYPRRYSAMKSYIVTIAYTVFTAWTDWMTGGNYMFLKRRPHSWSILNLFGPWPWYIVVAGVVGALLFMVLNLPFWHMRRQGKQPVADQPKSTST